VLDYKDKGAFSRGRFKEVLMETMKNADDSARAEFRIRGKNLVIAFNEDLDHHNALYVRKEADKLLENAGIRNIIFDFKDVGFMDSSGIGVIMGRYKKVIFTGGKIAAINVTPAADRILMLSGLYRILPKFDNLKAVLDEWK